MEVSLVSIAKIENRLKKNIFFFLKLIIEQRTNSIESISAVFLDITKGINGKKSIRKLKLKYFFPSWYIKKIEIKLIISKFNIATPGISKENNHAIKGYIILEYLYE